MAASLGSGASSADAGAAYIVIVASLTESFGDGDTGRLWQTGADHWTSDHLLGAGAALCSVVVGASV